MNIFMAGIINQKIDLSAMAQKKLPKESKRKEREIDMQVLKRFYYRDYTENGERHWEIRPRNFYVGNGKEIFRVFRKLAVSGYASAYEDTPKFDANKTYILWVNREFIRDGKVTIFYDCDKDFIEMIKRNEVK